MVNNVILVGRLVKTPELSLTDTGRKMSMVTLAVPRDYKNINGEYDTDFIDCTLWMGIAENTAEYCKTGDVIGVKGKIQTRIIENDDGSKFKRVDVIAEKVTFIASSKSNKEVKSIDINDDIKDLDEAVEINVVNEETSKYGKKSKKTTKKNN